MKQEEESEEEFRDLLFNEERYERRANKNSKKSLKKVEETQETQEIPNYYKVFKLNKFNMILSFHFSDDSSWNLHEAKIKFHEFYNNDKFCTFKDVVT